MSEMESIANGPLFPPASLQPPRSSRGALGVWPQLLDAVENLSQNPISLAEFKETYGISFGSSAQLIDSLAHNPDYLTGQRKPVEIYSQFVRLVTRSGNASAVISRSLLTLKTVLVDGESASSEVAKEILIGEGGLAQTATALAGEYAVLQDKLEGVENGRKDAFADFHQAGQALRENAEVLANTPRENLASLQYVVQTAEANIAARLNELSIASSKVAIGAVLANMIAAVRSVANGWTETAKAISGLVDSSSDAQLASLEFFDNELELEQAVSEWEVLTEECTRYTANFLVTS